MEQNMEIEASNEEFVVDTTGATVTALLHPVVIVNISEHWTRTRAQEGKTNQVAGALIGKFKEDRVLEIMNSFELVSDVIDSDDCNLVNLIFYYQKEELFQQVFPDLVFLGWYITGNATPTKSDLKNHKYMSRIYEHCLLLKLDPHGCHKDSLPITLYESVIHEHVNGEPKMLFVQVDYNLAADEAERIGVNHVVEVANSESNESSNLAEVLTVKYNAIGKLHERVKMLLEYVKAVQNKELPEDHKILREIKALSCRLPVMHQSPKFDAEFYKQCNDVALITYLGLMTKSCNNLNQFFCKFNILNPRRFTYSLPTIASTPPKLFRLSTPPSYLSLSDDDLPGFCRD